jgi:MOSC domain-containing protein YiiM
MPALVPTDHVAEVVWLGRNADRDAALRTVAVPSLTMTFAGPLGESRAGLTRPSDSRVVAQHPKGTEIRNVRQVSILSEEEIAEIAARIGIPALDPAWFGATMILRGIPDLTLVPPSSRLKDEASGATLTVDMENLPCHLVSREIEAEHPGHGRAFKAAARNRRGITAWVEREGEIAVGAQLRLHVPNQPPWPHHASART